MATKASINGLLIGLTAVLLSLWAAKLTAESPRPKDGAKILQEWQAYVQQGKTTLEMHRRLGEAKADLQQKIDLELDRQRNIYDRTRDELLNKNQAAWKHYCDTLVELAADEYRGGSLSGMRSGDAHITELSRRLDELADLFVRMTAP